jgi:hypothetical protein
MLRVCSETLTKLYFHEFHLWTHCSVQKRCRLANGHTRRYTRYLIPRILKNEASNTGQKPVNCKAPMKSICSVCHICCLLWMRGERNSLVVSAPACRRASFGLESGTTGDSSLRNIYFQQLSTMHDDLKGTVYRKNQIWDLKPA